MICRENVTCRGGFGISIGRPERIGELGYIAITLDGRGWLGDNYSPKTRLTSLVKWRYAGTAGHGWLGSLNRV